MFHKCSMPSHIYIYIYVYGSVPNIWTSRVSSSHPPQPPQPPTSHPPSPGVKHNQRFMNINATYLPQIHHKSNPCNYVVVFCENHRKFHYFTRGLVKLTNCKNYICGENCGVHLWCICGVYVIRMWYTCGPCVFGSPLGGL